MRFKVIRSFAYFYKQLLLVLSLKGAVTIEHCIEKDAERPAVSQKGIVRSLTDDFWSHIGRSSAVLVDNRVGFN